MNQGRHLVYGMFASASLDVGVGERQKSRVIGRRVSRQIVMSVPIPRIHLDGPRSRRKENNSKSVVGNGKEKKRVKQSAHCPGVVREDTRYIKRKFYQFDCRYLSGLRMLARDFFRMWTRLYGDEWRARKSRIKKGGSSNSSWI